MAGKDEKDEDEKEVNGAVEENGGQAPFTDTRIFNLIDQTAQRFANLRDRPLMHLLYPSYSSVESPHAITVYNAFRNHGQKFDDLDIIVHSRGGDIHEVYDITKLCKNYTEGTVTLFVPLQAMSAATLLALGVDKIVLSEIGKIGPLDPQVPHPERNLYMPVHAVTEVPRVLEEALASSTDDVPLEVKGQSIIKPMAEQVDPYFLTQNDETHGLAEQYGKRLLRRRGISSEKAERCLECLISDYPSHSYSIDHDELENNVDLHGVLDAEQVKELEDGGEIEELMVNLAELFLYWDYKYFEDEPRKEVLIDLFTPEKGGEQSTLSETSSEDEPKTQSEDHREDVESCENTDERTSEAITEDKDGGEELKENEV